MESLDSAIAQLIGLGEKDPLTVARRIEELYGRECVVAWLSELREDIVAELARQALGRLRRTYEIALRPGDQIASAEMGLAGVWVPGPDGYAGWKRAVDLTAADLIAKAQWYERLATGSQRRAQWCYAVAEMMEADGAATMGDLTRALPPLPDAVELVA